MNEPIAPIEDPEQIALRELYDLYHIPRYLGGTLPSGIVLPPVATTRFCIFCRTGTYSRMTHRLASRRILAVFVICINCTSLISDKRMKPQDELNFLCYQRDEALRGLMTNPVMSYSKYLRRRREHAIDYAAELVRMKGEFMPDPSRPKRSLDELFALIDGDLA